MDYLIPLALLVVVQLVARRSGTSPPKAFVLTALAYLVFAVGAPRVFGSAGGDLWHLVAAAGITIAGFVVMPARRQSSAPVATPVTAPSVDRGATSVAELVVPRSWGASEQADAALADHAERARAAAAGGGPDRAEEALIAFYKAWQGLTGTHDELQEPSVQARVWDWFELAARVARIPDVPALREGLKNGTWRIASTPFRPPSHGRISAAQLLEAATACIVERSAAGHMELPGFGAFSCRRRGEDQSLVFHDDSEGDLQLADTPFVEDLAARLEVSPKVATNASMKLFGALLEQVQAAAENTAWVAVPGLGSFELRRTAARSRLAFLPEPPTAT